ncbi:MAG TPA: isoprenylcysteine carboxylmethyltransferase family protein [Caulobacteraceae bacterium]|nr:isoprenylcysteine carboxylmethyltransferase family protein [Caulobacteraceae bacterium]
MSRPTLVLVLVGGFLGGVVGAAFVWAAQNGFISGGGARTYQVALRADMPRMVPGILAYLLFALYSSFAAGQAAQAQSTEPRWSTTLHQGLILIAFAAIILPIPGLAARFVPSAGWVVAVGLVVELGGIVLAVLARRALGRNWSAEVRLSVDHELVRAGVYRRLRHPISAGVLLTYLGLALQSGRPNALAGVARAAAAYWRKIGLEEQLLKARFGKAFEDWRKGSWALIPPPL